MDKEGIVRELVRVARELVGAMNQRGYLAKGLSRKSALETEADVFQDFAIGLDDVLKGLKNEIRKAEDGWASVEYLAEKIGVLNRRLDTLKKNLRIIARSRL